MQHAKPCFRKYPAEVHLVSFDNNHLVGNVIRSPQFGCAIEMKPQSWQRLSGGAKNWPSAEGIRLLLVSIEEPQLCSQVHRCFLTEGMNTTGDCSMKGSTGGRRAWRIQHETGGGWGKGSAVYRGFHAYLIMHIQVVQVKTWSKKVSVGEDRQDWHSAGFSIMTQEGERKLGHSSL